MRQTEDKTIFVKNLPFDVTVEEMKTLFINAIDVRLLTKNNGHCRGKAFVEMNSVEKAENASQERDKNGIKDGQLRRLAIRSCYTKPHKGYSFQVFHELTMF